jgi:orotate phosphoribosyltransferase
MVSSQILTTIREDTARLLVEAKAVSFDADHPFQFVSGIKSPVYVDNRKLISYPDQRKIIIKYLVEVLTQHIGKYAFDVVAGTATAGVPWASWVANELDVPLVYVRPTAKDRGLKKQIEGSLKTGQRCVVIEDLVTTGLSSCNVAEAIRSEGAAADSCIAIFTFGGASALERFRVHQLNIWTLTDLSSLLKVARNRGYANDSEVTATEHWSKTF